jgi:hypothetical protein
VRRARLIVVAVILTLAAPPLGARPPADVENAAKAAIRSLDLQTALPHQARAAERPRESSLPPEVIWVVLALGAALLIYGIRHDLPILRLFARNRWAAPAAPIAAGEPLRPAEVAADDLARTGRFVDAMHLLLLHSLNDIRQRLGEFSDSLTSREILRSPRLSEPARALLGDIVARVELSYFGGYPAGDADYAQCRRSYDALAQALDRPAAA